MTDNERLIKEKEFHDERFGGEDSARKNAKKYYSIVELALRKYREIAIENLNNGHLLEYGCATGQESMEWLSTGASITGIDISSEAIKKATLAVENSPYKAKAKYLEMNAENMLFEDGVFDVVVGNGIIHHLDLEESYSEIARVLKPGGHAVFIEPMGHNPMINLYRKLTPAMRTEDEHPLKSEDILMAKKYFSTVECNHYNLFSLLSVPFRNTSAFRPILTVLHLIDAAIFKIPFLKRYSWTVVIDMSDPKK